MKNTKTNNWLIYSLITAVFWGVWGALIEIPEKNGFPATLGYVVWALTVVPIGVFALIKLKGKLNVDKKSIFYGLSIGLLGSAGQLLLFEALKTGPAYLVFPFISIAPVITILLSFIILKETAIKRTWVGIIIAVSAIFLLSYQPPGDSASTGHMWIIFALLVATMWGLQGFVLKTANNSMAAESLIVYNMIAALAIAPIAIWMTDFSQEINWSFNGPGLTAIIQFLNAIGFLTLVYAFRYGKAIVVSPMVNALPPVITVIISLLLYKTMPHYIIVIGMVMAIVATFLLATEPDSEEVESDKIEV
jgi:uncharacterized membrane protein